MSFEKWKDTETVWNEKRNQYLKKTISDLESEKNPMKRLDIYKKYQSNELGGYSRGFDKEFINELFVQIFGNTDFQEIPHQDGFQYDFGPVEVVHRFYSNEISVRDKIKYPNIRYDDFQNRHNYREDLIARLKVHQEKSIARYPDKNLINLCFEWLTQVFKEHYIATDFSKWTIFRYHVKFRRTLLSKKKTHGFLDILEKDEQHYQENKQNKMLYNTESANLRQEAVNVLDKANLKEILKKFRDELGYSVYSPEWYSIKEEI